MSIYKNKVILIGNLGNNPEIRKTKNGKEYTIISLATKTSSKNKDTGEREEFVEWHNVAIFKEGIVNFAKEYAKKGDSAYVEGSLSTSKWQDDAGKDQFKTQIVVSSFEHDFQIVQKDNKASENK